MKKLLALGSVLVATALFADAELIKSAKDFGLEPLPKDAAELTAALNKINVKPMDVTPEKINLGKMLYFEPRLSKSSIISCNTCHNLAAGGVDGVPASTGHAWAPNPHHVNAPTTLNSVLNSAQFWDGRAADLAAQAQGPMVAEPEMASTPELIEARLKSMPEYVELFKIYKDGITFANVADAIGAFETTLITPTRFDDFLNGKEDALSAEEQAGLKVFLDKGCATCHNGPILGGTMQPFGVAGKYAFADTGDFKGDANGMVRTPTLLNINRTAPYFHNGMIWDLAEAVKQMGSVQLGIEINDDEAKSIVTFLKALDGKMPEITYPVLPASTNDTPKPELNYK